MQLEHTIRTMRSNIISGPGDWMPREGKTQRENSASHTVCLTPAPAPPIPKPATGIGGLCQPHPNKPHTLQLRSTAQESWLEAKRILSLPASQLTTLNQPNGHTCACGLGGSTC